MQSMKETASNIVASAKAGMEKTKATVQEKVEKMSTSDAMEKDRATQKKEDRINQAEMHKHEVQESNAAARQGPGTGGYSTGGDSSDFSSGTMHRANTGTGGYSSGARHGAGGITSDYSSSGGYTSGSGGVGTGAAATTYGGRTDDLLTGGLSTTKTGGYSTGDDYGTTGGTDIGSTGHGSAGYSSGGTGMMGGNEYGTAGRAGGGIGGLSSKYGSGERGGITDSEYGIGGTNTAAGGGIMDSEYGIGGTNTAASGGRGGTGSEYGRDNSTTGYHGMDSDEMRGASRHGYETRGSSRNQGGGIMDSEYGIGGTNTAASGDRGGTGSEYGRDNSSTGYHGMDSDEIRGASRHGYETRGSSRNQGGPSDY